MKEILQMEMAVKDEAAIVSLSLNTHIQFFIKIYI